jgi:hypothetical protein
MAEVTAITEHQIYQGTLRVEIRGAETIEVAAIFPSVFKIISVFSSLPRKGHEFRY